MLKQAKSPDGYKYLLVYKKADELLAETLRYTGTFPHDKTGIGLADQMDRSARSVKANIVEGWKRNATHEYYTFLGYAIASNAELLEDYLDICLGRYEAKGVKGETKGENGQNRYEAKGLPAAPSAAQAGIQAGKGRNGVEEKGEKGEKGKKEWLENLRFYPLDKTLPSAVQLYLRCKELNMLLEKLQASLLERMQEKKTLSEDDRRRLVNDRIRKKEEENETWYKEELRKRNLVMTSHGLKNKDEAVRQGLVWWNYGDPEP